MEKPLVLLSKEVLAKNNQMPCLAIFGMQCKCLISLQCRIKSNYVNYWLKHDRFGKTKQKSSRQGGHGDPLDCKAA